MNEESQHEEIKVSEQENQFSKLTLNAQTLTKEVDWLAKVINARLSDYFSEDKHEIKQEAPKSWKDKMFHRKTTNDSKTASVSSSSRLNSSKIELPDLTDNHSVYAEFVNYYKLTKEERFMLTLAIIPQIQPHLLDVFFTVNKTLGRGYTEFGGITAKRHSGFIPTVETYLFLLAGNDLDARFRLYRLFEPDHIFSAHGIILFDQGIENESFYSSSILISEEYVDFFTTGNIRKPQFSAAFPAKRLTTKMDWSDLIVDELTAKQLDEIRIWLQHGQTLLNEWEMDKHLKPGYKALFYGDPGTGKTLTAALLGKLHGLEVYRVDLSMVISKYIGETEKNLEKVFKKAENKNWILFLDEADALLGKRITISDSNSKYANQEIAYLLQRLEDYPGLVILATNMRNNMDDAFTRRLQSIVHFQRPQPRERLRLWKNAFSRVSQPPADEEMQRIAQQYELSGGSIINVVQYASLKALSRDNTVISADDVVTGIRKEFSKEGKII